MTKIITKVIQWNSKEYEKGIILRNELLNKTAKLPLLKKAPKSEKKFIHIVAFLGSEVVGTLYIMPLDKDTVQIKQVAVSNEYQGMGIGKSLMKYSEDMLKKVDVLKWFFKGAIRLGNSINH